MAARLELVSYVPQSASGEAKPVRKLLLDKTNLPDEIFEHILSFLSFYHGGDFSQVAAVNRTWAHLVVPAYLSLERLAYRNYCDFYMYTKGNELSAEQREQLNPKTKITGANIREIVLSSIAFARNIPFVEDEFPNRVGLFRGLYTVVVPKFDL